MSGGDGAAAGSARAEGFQRDDAFERGDASGRDDGTERTAGTGRGEGSGPGVLARITTVVRATPAFARLLYRLLSDRRVSLLDRALFGGTLVYLFVPFDLVPDWIPGLGQLDDVLLVLFTLDRLLYRTPEEVLLQHWDGDRATLERLRDLVGRSADALPPWARGLLRSG